MLLTHDKWRTFTDRPIPAPTSSEVSLALALDSREALDAMIGVTAATAAPRTSTMCRNWASCTPAT